MRMLRTASKKNKMDQMNLKTVCLLTLLILTTGCATRNIPDTAKEINEECAFEMQAARTAIRLRDKGKTNEDLKSKLPPLEQNSLRLLKKMYEISDEVYQYTDLNEMVYTTYRFELCQRELLGKSLPVSTQTVLPDLLACQQQYQDKSSVKSANCILAGIENRSIKLAVPISGDSHETNN